MSRAGLFRSRPVETLSRASYCFSVVAVEQGQALRAKTTEKQTMPGSIRQSTNRERNRPARPDDVHGPSKLFRGPRTVSPSLLSNKDKRFGRRRRRNKRCLAQSDSRRTANETGRPAQMTFTARRNSFAGLVSSWHPRLSLPSWLKPTPLLPRRGARRAGWFVPSNRTGRPALDASVCAVDCHEIPCFGCQKTILSNSRSTRK